MFLTEETHSSTHTQHHVETAGTPGGPPHKVKGQTMVPDGCEATKIDESVFTNLNVTSERVQRGAGFLVSLWAARRTQWENKTSWESMPNTRSMEKLEASEKRRRQGLDDEL